MNLGPVLFTTAPDGLSIAYRSIGSGSPLVVMHNFTVSHIELEFDVPVFRTHYEELAQHHLVIRLDPRGTGLSGSAPIKAVDDVVADVLAVADALGIDAFDLLTTGTMAPVGVRLGASERVNRLILNEPEVDVLGNDYYASHMQAGEAMVKAGVGQHIAAFWVEGAGPEDIQPLRTLVETNVRDRTGESTQLLPWDARPWLGSVTSPTLITYTRSGHCGEQAREAAAAIPDARLAGLTGTDWDPDPEEYRLAIGEFLRWDATKSSKSSGLSVIVFTDVVASTDLVDRLGDDAARALVKEVEQLATAKAAAHGGRVVKHLGDGSLLEFHTASDALDFSHQLRAELRPGTLQVRVGMAAGEPIQEDGDLHGAVVVLASRINAAAAPGATYVSDGVKQLVAGKQFGFADEGQHSLKGFESPMRLWRLTE